MQIYPDAQAGNYYGRSKLKQHWAVLVKSQNLLIYMKNVYAAWFFIVPLVHNYIVVITN